MNTGCNPFHRYADKVEIVHLGPGPKTVREQLERKEISLPEVHSQGLGPPS